MLMCERTIRGYSAPANSINFYYRAVADHPARLSSGTSSPVGQIRIMIGRFPRARARLSIGRTDDAPTLNDRCRRNTANDGAAAPHRTPISHAPGSARRRSIATMLAVLVARLRREGRHA